MNAQGTGLGLSICKRMIEQMGGEVSVDSIYGKGTTFTIKINTKAKAKIIQVDRESNESNQSIVVRNPNQLGAALSGIIESVD